MQVTSYFTDYQQYVRENGDRDGKLRPSSKIVETFCRIFHSQMQYVPQCHRPELLSFSQICEYQNHDRILTFNEKDPDIYFVLEGVGVVIENEKVLRQFEAKEPKIRREEQVSEQYTKLKNFTAKASIGNALLQWIIIMPETS
jgi:hypothetical protein